MKWQSLLPSGAKPDFIVVGGPTASGKSAVALELAKSLSGSIVCCDSVQIYEGFDIGSAKPTKAEQADVPHYLFDLLSWDEPCDAAIYAAKAKEAMASIKAQDRIPIVVGGTGLYLRALLGESWDDDLPGDPDLRQRLGLRASDDLYQELQVKDPRRASELHANDRFRVIRALEINILTGYPVRQASVATPANRSHVMIFMNPPRETLYERINARVGQMLRDGLVDEVKGLMQQGVGADCKPMGSIGYKEVAQMLNGDLKPNDLETAIATATRQYAKRQVTWFKKVASDAVVENPHSVAALISHLRDLL
jgi:tRNA dimethylallyltransferase